MPEFKTLRLVRGHDVPMEDGSPWPAEGKTVEVTLYIRRRLQDGDLVEVEDPQPEAEDPKVVDGPTPGETAQDEQSGKSRKGAK